MRILIPSIQAPFIKGGAQLMTQGLKDSLIKHGHQVEVVTFPFKFYPSKDIINLMDFCLKQDFNLFNGYDIDCTISLQFPAYYVKHKKRILWLMHQHRSVYDLYNSNSSSDIKELKKKIHAYDTQELSQISSRYSMCQNVSNRLKKYNNIDSIPLYHPPFNESKFYCENNYNFIFYPSRLEELKRQDLLIKAMQYTKSPVVAIISGDGGQKQNYQQLIEKLNLNHKIKLIGFISEEEKRAFYARSLGVFFGPYDEDYGYVTLEAMLSKKPVITCKDSGGPLEFVVNNQTGFVVEANEKEIAEKIDWLYYNKHKAKVLGENGFENYKSKNISWDNVVEKLLEN